MKTNDDFISVLDTYIAKWQPLTNGGNQYIIHCVDGMDPYYHYVGEYLPLDQMGRGRPNVWKLARWNSEGEIDRDFGSKLNLVRDLS